MDGMKSSRIGKISSRPSSISSDRNIFENPVRLLKFPVGPSFPNPGPTLLKQVATADTISSKFRLSRPMMSIESPKRQTYIIT